MEKYADICREMLTFGVPASPRGIKTMEMLNYVMEFEAEEWFISFKCLNISYDYIRKELAWYQCGDRSDLSILDHAEIWKSCVDKNNLIQSNYGYYFNEQFHSVVTHLKEDPDTRRAVVNIHRPEHNQYGIPDMPCTMYLSFILRHGQLMMTAHMRSQDMVFGLRNDLPAFQMFKLAVANEIGARPGPLTIVVDSFHLYERHYNQIGDIAGGNETNAQASGPMTLLHLQEFIDAAN